VWLLLVWFSNPAAASTTLEFGNEIPNYLRQEKYTLFFILDGPAGDGLFQYPSEVQQFMQFHENLTQSFVPRFATLEEVQVVTTTCHYISQKSFDFPLTLAAAVPGAIYVEPTSQDLRHLQAVQPEEEEDELSNLFSKLSGNTTYGIVYIMEYRSSTVNVENYTLHYERVVYESFPELELGLRTWLDVPPASNLTILGVYNTQQPVETTALNPDQEQDSASGFLFPYNATWGPYNDTEAPSSFPTQDPSASASPSETPTISSEPSASCIPSLSPSIPPSATPTSTPTVAPSSHPTFHANSTSRGIFDFGFTMENVTHPTDLFQNLTLMCQLFVDMTPSLAYLQGHNPRHVYTTCADIRGGFFRTRAPTAAPIDQGEVDAITTAVRNNTQVGSYNLSNYGNLSLYLHNPQTIMWSYTMVLEYESTIWNVAGYPDALQDFVEDNPNEVEAELASVYELGSDDGTNLTIQHFRRLFVQTAAPTVVPTSSPSASPTEEKTEEPTFRLTIPTAQPTIVPSLPPSTMPVTDQSLNKQTTLVIVVVVVLVSSAMGMFGLFAFYRRRKRRLKELTKYRRPVIANGEITVELNNGDGLDSYGVATAEPHRADEHAEPRRKIHAQTGSGVVDASRIRETSNRADLVAGAIDIEAAETQQNVGSNQKKQMLMTSLLSDIDDDKYGSDEFEEAAIDVIPITQSPPADEFERYKDRNLEKMRSKVEDNVEGLDDMMSQAMTMALMMDGGASTTPKWYGARTGIEIEANALWEVTEWLKRHGDPELDDR
jgi:hypothetical protein